MNRRVIVLALAIAGVATQVSAQDRGADSVSIVQLLNQRAAALRARQVEPQVTLYASNALWINAFGIRRDGRESVIAFLRRLYAYPGYRDAKVTHETPAEVVFLRPDVAVANEYRDTEGQRLPNGTVINRRTRTTFVLTKEKGKWLIRQQYIADERSREGQQ
jgi:uncharacterized protein (TIGR02246 family)